MANASASPAPASGLKLSHKEGAESNIAKLNIVGGEKKGPRPQEDPDSLVSPADKEGAVAMIPAQSDTPIATKDSSSGAEISFNIVLNCTGDDPGSREDTLTIKHNKPLTVTDLKNAIQKDFSIPACCQCLEFDSVTLEDEMPLHRYHIRAEDTIRASFSSEGDVAEVLDIVEVMINSSIFIDSIQTDLSKKQISTDLTSKIVQNIIPPKIHSLAQTYFVPCSSDQAEVNRVLFVHCGGLNFMHNLHVQLLRQPWDNTPILMQNLEHGIMRVYWNITASFNVRMFVLSNPVTLESIIKTFLRIEIDPDDGIETQKNTWGQSHFTFDRVAYEVVYKALGALCNLAEIPECRAQIASNSGVLKQMRATLTTPAYRCVAALVTVAGMLCLSYSRDTHQYLATPTIIEGVIDACHTTRPEYKTVREKHLNAQLLKYFANIFFAHILSTSSDRVPPELRLRVIKFIEGFLELADFTEIREEEIKNGYKWSTLVPFMKLAYHPLSLRQRMDYGDKSSDELEMGRLYRCCIQCGIFGLLNVLQCPETRDIFVLEGLVDYLVSMPWIYPREWKERDMANSLVTMVSRKIQLQPPSLVNLTRGYLASMHFGLEKVLRTDSVHELLSDVYT